MQLTEQQSQVLDSLTSFIISEDQQYMVLKGFAGTGKTTVVAELIQWINQYNELAKALNTPTIKKSLTATTNKAASVLANATTTRATTIHSLLGLSVRYEQGKPVLYVRNSYVLNSDTPDIVIIDEASYINEELLEYIQVHLKDSKVLFIGDDTQLTPVGSEETTIFNQGYPTLELTELMRQPVGALQELCVELRKQVQSNEPFTVNMDNQEICLVSKEEFSQMIQDDMGRDDWKPSDSKVVCYTNTLALDVNNAVHTHKHGSPKFTSGDVLICNSHVNTSRQTIPTDSLVKIERVNDNQTLDVDIHKQTYMSINCCTYTINDEIFATAYDQNEVKAAIKYAIQQRDWITLEWLRVMFLDLRHSYACTVHKAQGSTYDTVYVDLDDLYKAIRNKDMYNRLLYVAVSRAAKKVVFTES